MTRRRETIRKIFRYAGNTLYSYDDNHKAFGRTSVYCQAHVMIGILSIVRKFAPRWIPEYVIDKIINLAQIVIQWYR